MLGVLKSIFEYIILGFEYLLSAIKTSLMGLDLLIEALGFPATFQFLLPDLLGLSCLAVTAVCAVKFIFGRQ